MANHTLMFTAGQQGITALLQRACHIDPQAIVRLRRRAQDGASDVLVTTPYQVVAARRATITFLPSADTSLCGDSVTVQARQLLDALQAAPEGSPVTCSSLGASWAGMAPPVDTWRLVDELPVGVVSQLSDEGARLAKQFAGPLGPPASLLDQVVIKVSDDTHTPTVSVDIPMRALFAITAFGFVPRSAASGAGQKAPRTLRVASSGSWLRIDAAYGSIYHAKNPLTLLR